MKEQRIEQGAIAIAGGWMHHKVGWFVDNNNMFVFEDYIEGNIFGLPVALGFNCAEIDQLFAAQQLLLGRLLLAVDLSSPALIHCCSRDRENSENSSARLDPVAPAVFVATVALFNGSIRQSNLRS